MGVGAAADSNILQNEVATQPTVPQPMQLAMLIGGSSPSQQYPVSAGEQAPVGGDRGNQLSMPTGTAGGMAPELQNASPVARAIMWPESRFRNVREDNGTGPADGYFQIETKKYGGSSTWEENAPKVGIDINKYDVPSKASYADQWKVAQSLPLNRWTAGKRGVLARWPDADPTKTVGELDAMYSGGPQPFSGKMQINVPVQGGAGVTSGPASLAGGNVAPSGYNSALGIGGGPAGIEGSIGSPSGVPPSLHPAPGVHPEIAQQRQPVNPLAMQDPVDMRKLMALSMLRSMLGSGMGFQRVSYDPWKVYDRWKGSVSAGMPIGYGGMPQSFQATRIGSPQVPAAYSPGSQPSLSEVRVSPPRQRRQQSGD